MNGEDGFREMITRFADTFVPRDRALTGEEVAAAAGLDYELARRLRRAMGLPEVPEGEAAFYEVDVEAARHVKAILDAGELDAEGILHLARTLGLAAARMADALVGFWAERASSWPQPVIEQLDPVQRARDLEEMVSYLVRRHILDAITRWFGATVTPESSHVVAVGFADLVGFTSLSEQLTEVETARLIERFESLATDAVVAGGGRVVKMIGDEVMFSAEPSHVAEIAVSLAETFQSPDLPAVRVGVAAGTVVAQSGDLFGPVVNLAARAAIAARPGTVLVSPDLAESLRADRRYALTPLRPHRLKGIGTVDLEVLRRAGDGQGNREGAEPAPERRRRSRPPR